MKELRGTGRLVVDWATGLILFLATAAVVVWQNSRLGVLWDLSYLLENSYRIALGDVPYRDFPFPYAPLTFLVQAAIIKLTGRVFWHHIAYCAIVGGLSTVVTWRILLRLLVKIPQRRILAFGLATPLTILGIYSIYPHPFYDADGTFVILIGILLLLHVDAKDLPSIPIDAGDSRELQPNSIIHGWFARLMSSRFARLTLPCSTGFVLVLPLFIKQNVGLALLLALIVTLVFGIAIKLWRRQSLRGYVILIASASFGLGLALLAIHWWAGLRNYEHWTIQFAAARRTPNKGEMLGIYKDRLLLWWFPVFAAGLLLWQWHRRVSSSTVGEGTDQAVKNDSGEAVSQRTEVDTNQRLPKWAAIPLCLLSAILLTVPFTWAVTYLRLDTDISERAERLLSLWPFVIILATVFAAFRLRRYPPLTALLPLVVIGTAHGAFLSQQLWGSTYALWPLFIILVACLLSTFEWRDRKSPVGLSLSLLPELSTDEVNDKLKFSGDGDGWVMLPATIIMATCLLIAGLFYVRSHERLEYANLDDGELVHSQLPPLRGLSMRGSWLPNFEELVRYADQNIPRDDGILMLPGEDLFYYTTGRRPRFPVLMFDHTVNPLSAEEIVQLARERNIRWVIVKDELQLEEEPMAEKDRVLELLKPQFKSVETLSNYEIFRRRLPGEKDEDEDNDDVP